MADSCDDAPAPLSSPVSAAGAVSVGAADVVAPEAAGDVGVVSFDALQLASTRENMAAVAIAPARLAIFTIVFLLQAVTGGYRMSQR